MWTWCTPQDLAAHPTVQYDFTYGVYLILKLPHTNSYMCMGRDLPRGTYRTEEGGSPGGGGQHLVPPHVAQSLGEPFRDLLVRELAVCAASGLSVLLATNCSLPLPIMFHFPTCPTVLLSQMLSSVWPLHQSFHHLLVQQPCLLQLVTLHFSLSLQLLHGPLSHHILPSLYVLYYSISSVSLHIPQSVCPTVHPLHIPTPS